MKKFWITILVVAVLVSVAWAVTLDVDSEVWLQKEERRSLAGLEGVGVLIKMPEAEEYGFQADELQVIAELGLRRNGIKVLTDEEFVKARGNPYLDVSVTMVGGLSDDEVILGGAAAAMVDVALKQSVLLQRDPTILYRTASTWNKSVVWIGGVERIGESVKETVKKYIDEFSNDYLAVNPIEKPVPEKDEK